MKRSRLFLSIALAALALMPVARNHVYAQSSDPATPSLATGTEYYVAFMQNEDKRGAATRFMGLMITSDVATIGQVEIPGSVPQQFTTQPGTVTTIEIPRTLEMKYGEEPPLPCVHITSRSPVAVFVLNSLYQSSGGYAAVPVDLWRSTYMPMGLPNADGERVSEFTIVAAYDTHVTIAPSTQTNFKEAWQSIDVNLKRGESFLVQARPGIAGVADLSTSEITATQPIGVIAGHVRTPISPTHSTSLDLWASHEAVMVLSDSLWGHEYYSVPMRAVPDRFRLTPALDNTTIEVTHYPAGKAPEHAVIKLDRGDIFDSSTINGRPITGPVHWSSSQPFILMQMRVSSGYGDAANSPAVLPLTSADRFSNHTSFVAPSSIGGNAITSHTLTIVAKGAASDPVGSLAGIMLDGKDLKTIDPSATWSAIEDNVFSMTLGIPAGGHVLHSPSTVTFTATITGNDGALGDFYSWTAPFWLPQTEADVTPPHIAQNLPAPGKTTLAAIISDKTPTYFSGVASVTVSNSPGWRVVPFSVPYPDNDAEVHFEAIADPSGPLTIEMRDRNGNAATAKLSDGLCGKTAYPDRDRVVIHTTEGAGKVDSVIIGANPCGNAAVVHAIDFGNGNAKDHLTIGFAKSGFPLSIGSNARETLYFTVDNTTAKGTYFTTVTLTLDSATIILPVELDVDARASVALDEGVARMAMTLSPNPFTSSTQIGFGRALGHNAEITICDYLGRAVRRIGGDQAAGHSTLTWDGADDRGAVLPAGVYIVTAFDGTNRSVRTATLIR